MGSLINLLKWKTTVTLHDSKGKPILGEDKTPRKVYMRIIGDNALKEVYKKARLASSEKRKELANVTSEAYKTEVDIFDGVTREECINAIKIANATGWTNEAMSVVTRGDEVEIDSVAADPDAPSLEEQEKCDALNKEVDEKYISDIQAYVLQKSAELDAELSKLDQKGLELVAHKAQATIIPLMVFMERMQIEKTWRGCYDDEKHTIPSFSSLEEFLETDTGIKEQLTSAYTKLEISGDDIKNS